MSGPAASISDNHGAAYAMPDFAQLVGEPGYNYLLSNFSQSNLIAAAQYFDQYGGITVDERDTLLSAGLGTQPNAKPIVPPRVITQGGGVFDMNSIANLMPSEPGALWAAAFTPRQLGAMANYFNFYGGLSDQGWRRLRDAENGTVTPDPAPVQATTQTFTQSQVIVSQTTDPVTNAVVVKSVDPVTQTTTTQTTDPVTQQTTTSTAPATASELSATASTSSLPSWAMPAAIVAALFIFLAR